MRRQQIILGWVMNLLVWENGNFTPGIFSNTLCGDLRVFPQFYMNDASFVSGHGLQYLAAASFEGLVALAGQPI